MEATAYAAYFEGLATKNKAIGHSDERPKFCRFNIEEILTGLATNLDTSTPCLFLENFEGRLSEEGDQVYDNQDAAFHVLCASDPTDFEAQHAIFDQAKRIGLQLVGRMRKEARAGGVLRYLDRNSFAYETVSRAFENCFGYRFTFSFYNPLSLAENAADWND